jgi:hypothetical protein
MSPGYLRALGWELDGTDQTAGRAVRLFAEQLAGVSKFFDEGIKNRPF